MVEKKGKIVLVRKIITALIVGVLVLTVINSMAEALSMWEVGCDKFCSLHVETADYPWYAWVPSWVPGSDVSWSEILRDQAKQLRNNMADPESQGCYCGVAEGTGRFIHLQGGIRGQDEDPKVREFHLTDDPMDAHLGMELPNWDFDHTGALGRCREVVAEYGKVDFNPQVNTIPELERASSCIIVSEWEERDGCSIWQFEEGFEIDEDAEGDTIEEQALEQEKLVNVSMVADDEDEWNKDVDLVSALEFGTAIDQGDEHASQRMLLQHPDLDVGLFRIPAPIACRSRGLEERKITHMLDKACKEHCEDEELFYMGSDCVEEPRGVYEPVPVEYIEEYGLEGFCDEGYPHCICRGETQYYWESDHEFIHDSDYIMAPEPEDSSKTLPDVNITFAVNFEHPPVNITVEVFEEEDEFFTYEELERNEVGLVEIDEIELNPRKSYTWNVSLTDSVHQEFSRSFSFQTLS